jgi:polar amino acid transport system substrate-binding protein
MRATNRREFLIASLATATLSPSLAAPPIRMGYADMVWAFSRRNPDGTASGLLVDSINFLGEKCGLDFTHFAYPWARTQEMVKSGLLDAFCTSRVKERLEYADFCNTPLSQTTFGAFHRKEDTRVPDITSVKDMRAFRQGTYHANGYALQFLEMGQMHMESNTASLLRLIALNALDIFVAAESDGTRLIAELGLQEKIEFTPLYFLPKGEFCFGLRKNFPDAQAILAKMDAVTKIAVKSKELPLLQYSPR